MKPKCPHCGKPVAFTWHPEGRPERTLGCCRDCGVVDMEEER